MLVLTVMVHMLMCAPMGRLPSRLIESGHREALVAIDPLDDDLERQAWGRMHAPGALADPEPGHAVIPVWNDVPHQAKWDMSSHQELDIRERLSTLGTEGGKMRIEGKKHVDTQALHH